MDKAGLRARSKRKRGPAQTQSTAIPIAAVSRRKVGQDGEMKALSLARKLFISQNGFAYSRAAGAHKRPPPYRPTLLPALNSWVTAPPATVTTSVS